MEKRSITNMFSRHFRVRRSWFLIGFLAVILVVSFITGYFYWIKLSFDPPTARTRYGHFFERLVPKGAFFVASFNPSDLQERARFQNLWSAVLQDKKNAFLPFVAVEFARLNGLKISPEDFAPLLENNAAFTLALAPRNEKTRDSRSDLFVFLSARDLEKSAAPLMAAFSKEKGRVFSGIIDDVSYITTSENAKKTVIELFKRKRDSLASTKIFREVFENTFAPLTGYIFVRSNTLVSASLTVLQSMPGTLTVATHTLKNPELPAKSYIKAVFASYIPYLYKKIPAQNALLFAESHHLGAALETFIKESSVKSFESSFGLNFKNDLAPFLQNGFAFVLQHTTSLLPGVTLYIDAAENKEKAEKFLQKLDQQIAAWVELGKAVFTSKQKESPVFEVSKNPRFAHGTSIVIHTNRISEESSDMPLLRVLPEGITFSYGLTEDNVLFFSSLPDVELVFVERKLLTENLLFKEIARNDAQLGGLLLFDVKEMLKYFDIAAKRLKEYKTFSAENDKAYGILQKYLNAIAGFAQVSQGDDSRIKSRGILIIQPTTRQ